MGSRNSGIKLEFYYCDTDFELYDTFYLFTFANYELNFMFIQRLLKFNNKSQENIPQSNCSFVHLRFIMKNINSFNI